MIKESYQQLWQDGKKYLELRSDLLRVELLEKISLISAMLLTIVVVLVLGLIAYAYLSALLLLWFNTLFGCLWPGLCILAGFNLVLILLAIVFKKQLFVNPLVRGFSKILYAETTQKQETKP